MSCLVTWSCCRVAERSRVGADAGCVSMLDGAVPDAHDYLLLLLFLFGYILCVYMSV